MTAPVVPFGSTSDAVAAARYGRFYRFPTAGAIVASRLACADAMPDAGEVAALLGGGVGPRAGAAPADGAGGGVHA